VISKKCPENIAVICKSRRAGNLELGPARASFKESGAPDKWEALCAKIVWKRQLW